MADIAGLILAIPSLVQTCVVAYQVLSSSTSITRNSRRLHLLLEIEKNRLIIAGKGLGVIGSGAQGEENDPKYIATIIRQRIPNDASIHLVHRILDGICATLTDLEKLTRRYGLHIDVKDQAEGESNTALATTVAPMVPFTTAKPKVSIRKSLRWVIRDQSLFAQLISELEKMNDALEEQFTEQQRWNLHALLPSQYLDISAAADIEDIQSVSTKYPFLDQALQFRSFIATLRDAGDQLTTSILTPSMATLTNVIAVGSDNHYSVAQLRPKQVPWFADESKDILIEWKTISQGFLHEHHQTLRLRVNKLATILKYASAMTGMRVLRCEACYDDVMENNRIGLVYSLTPSPNPDSLLTRSTCRQSVIQLWQLLGPSKKMPPLGDRFALATVLCQTTLQLHSVGWLHKGFRSHNIVFVQTLENALNQIKSPPSEVSLKSINITEPLLLGFDYARPNLETEISETVEFLYEEYNLYRHPELLAPRTDQSTAVTRHSWKFDIYSLGCVLLEIGLWKRLLDLWKPKYQENPFVFSDRLVKVWTAELESRCGTIYADAVRSCLQGFPPEDINNSQHGSIDNIGELDCFFQRVICTLQSCKA